VGESGSGKTTVLKCLAGLFTHWQGELAIDGQPLGHEISRERCRQVQMVFQDPYGSLHPRHTIGDILEEPLQIHVSKTATGGFMRCWIKLASTARFATVIRISFPAGSVSAWRLPER
jgi:ABC-type dipeptide/oligopeptide/nickel transport system ATPase subunit